MSIRHCSRCLYPETHPLGIVLDDEGVCSGCRVHEEKDFLDWDARFELLREMVRPYRSASGLVHDCVVPVSGAGDSFFIVDVVKNRLKLNPLLVAYNKQYNTPTGIRNLARLRTEFDCDFLQMNVSPASVKAVTRASLRLMGSMYWHCIAGHTVFPVQIAARFKIPLVLWGAHQGVEQVGMYSHLDAVEMSRKYRQEHDLMGFEAEDLLRLESGLAERDVLPFVYPHERELAQVGVRGVYLGNFIRWDTKAQHEVMMARHGYEPLAQQRTFDAYNHADSFHYSGVHDYIKYLKHGYSKVVDHACREIRYGRLSRDEALGIVECYQAVEPNDLDMFLDWVGMAREEFFECVNAHRNPRVWSKNGSEWRSRLFWPEAGSDRELPGCGYLTGATRTVSKSRRSYVLIGRGWRDEEGNARD
ncbi:N-acetyl sugar amidotransferase [Pseudodesulfovibrio tunisiensis]|uniref:N-acetyl sugar amidotransferase n=1 Tax=Pseudodesulfovibrio tunisiensis TaxID=463192 RepID=UPI001FB34054|nr:N-acetyl sugar amidotransferase [Pseudodesulfovibrio tunisiensis]